MTTTTVTKEQIREKVGKKWWLDNEKLLAAKLVYEDGISTFDNILGSSSLEDLNAVIHLEKYPKGLLFKIAKDLGFTTYPHPISFDEIDDVTLFESSKNGGRLSFDLENNSKINFLIRTKEHVREVKAFLQDINMDYRIEKMQNPIEDKPPKAIQNNQKHGIPALLSFAFPGLGQLIKGHVLKAIVVWGALFFIWFTFFGSTLTGNVELTFILWIMPSVVWLWNVYDAYNSNQPKLASNEQNSSGQEDET
jgi:hypothetical protein